MFRKESEAWAVERAQWVRVLAVQLNPKCNPQDTHGGRWELAPASYPLIDMHLLTHVSMHPHMYTCILTGAYRHACSPLVHSPHIHIYIPIHVYIHMHVYPHTVPWNYLPPKGGMDNLSTVTQPAIAEYTAASGKFLQHWCSLVVMHSLTCGVLGSIPWSKTVSSYLALAMPPVNLYSWV